MFFIVRTPSPLFQKLQEINKKMRSANKSALDLAKTVGCKQIRRENFQLAGGISSFYFKEKPDGFAYTRTKKHPNDFFPKKIIANKELLKKISELPLVEYQELNDLVGFDERKHSPAGRWMFCPNISWHKDFVLLDFKSAEKYKPIVGMKEILYSEFEKLSKAK